MSASQPRLPGAGVTVRVRRDDGSTFAGVTIPTELYTPGRALQSLAAIAGLSASEIARAGLVQSVSARAPREPSSEGIGWALYNTPEGQSVFILRDDGSHLSYTEKQGNFSVGRASAALIAIGGLSNAELGRILAVAPPASTPVPPGGLGWSPAFPFAVVNTGTGWRLANDPRSYVNPAIWTVAPYYVNPARPDNTGDGLSLATAKRDINAAITTSNADGQAAGRIICVGGDYFQPNSFNGTVGNIEPTKPCGFINQSGRVRAVCGTSENTWAPYLTASFAGGPSSGTRVFDRINLDANGDYTELTNVADAATVDTTPNSWVNSSVTGTAKVHIRRSDGLQPSLANTLIVRNITTSSFIAATNDLYFEGFDIEGGRNGALWIDPIASRNVVVNNCTVKYGGDSVGLNPSLRIRRNQGLVLICDTIAAGAYTDAFNYHSDNAAAGTMFVLQSGCIGRGYGKGAATSCNGFTGHDDVVGMDIGGRYYGGTAVGADVHWIEQSRVWLLGTQVTQSAASFGGVTGSGGNAPIKSSDTARTYIEACVITAQPGADALNAQGGLIAKRNSVIVGTELPNSGGSIVNY